MTFIVKELTEILNKYPFHGASFLFSLLVKLNSFAKGIELNQSFFFSGCN